MAVGFLFVLPTQAIGLWFASLLIGAHLSAAALLAGASGVLACVGLLMLSQALGASIEALYERHDLEWLLTSPVPFRRVLLVRMAGAAVQVAFTWMVFVVGPVANGLAVLGRPGALAAYPVLLVLALLVTAAGSAAAILLVSAAGLRRARSAVNVLAAVSGAAIFLAMQSLNLLPNATRDAVLNLLSPGDGSGLAWLPARAMLGAPGPLLLVLVVGLGAAMLAARRLERRFILGAVSNAATARRPTARDSTLPRFRANQRGVLLHKELRLLRRSPGLLGQTLLQTVYLLPAVFLIARDGTAVLPAAAAGIVFLTGGIARLMISATISGDGAAELARTAPTSAATVRLAKLEATGLFLAGLLTLPVLLAAYERPSSLPAFVAGLVGVTGSAMLLALQYPAITRARDLGGARKPSGSELVNLAISTLWAAGTWFMAV